MAYSLRLKVLYQKQNIKQDAVLMHDDKNKLSVALDSFTFRDLADLLTNPEKISDKI